jgi:plasmid stability protein
MAQLLVRNLDEDVKAPLRVRAAQHGRSMEEEVRVILREAVVAEQDTVGLGTRIAARFARAGLRDDEQLPDVFRRATMRSVEFD